jgi:hypothetical protein
MYLAKFLHRPPGKDDRELLLIVDRSGGKGHSSDRALDHALDHAFLGFVLDGRIEPYMRRDFASAREAVAEFRRAAEELREAGYVETAHTKYSLRKLPPEPKPKPAWQQGLDELLLSAIIDDAATQTALIAKLATTPAVREPVYLWLVARHGFAAAPKRHARALALAENARDVLGARRASRTPPYIWSLWPLEVEAAIRDLLCEIHFAAGNAKAALDAAQHAQEVAGDAHRAHRIAWLICHHFPAREEEAFEQAWRHAEHGGYESITALPGYAAYVERRKRRARREPGWRWGGRNEAASETTLREVERKLATALPTDYRDFLKTPSRTELLIRTGEDSAKLRFYTAKKLIDQRDNLLDFITRSEKSAAAAEAHFRDRYGVSLRHLVPIAEPVNLSCAILIHLGKGERFGWCFRWDHNDARVLQGAQPSFEKVLAALTSGIERRDPTVLRFLGIHTE